LYTVLYKYPGAIIVHYLSLIKGWLHGNENRREVQKMYFLCFLFDGVAHGLYAYIYGSMLFTLKLLNSYIHRAHKWVEEK
jgi:hypothetical protein